MTTDKFPTSNDIKVLFSELFKEFGKSEIYAEFSLCIQFLINTHSIMFSYTSCSYINKPELAHGQFCFS